MHWRTFTMEIPELTLRATVPRTLGQRTRKLTSMRSSMVANALTTSCIVDRQTFTDLIDSLQVSYSDHFGLEVVFSIVPPEDGKISGGSKKFESRSDVLHRALLPIRQALHNAHVSQKNHLGVFLCLFGFDLILVAALTCASAWLPRLFTAAWFGGNGTSVRMKFPRACLTVRTGSLRAFIDEMETEAGLDP